MARLRRLLVDKSGERLRRVQRDPTPRGHHRDGNPNHNELSNLQEFRFHEA